MMLYRMVRLGVFGTVVADGPIRTSREEAERDAEQAREVGQRHSSVEVQAASVRWEML